MKAYPQPVSEEFIYASPEGQWQVFCRWVPLDQEPLFSQLTAFKLEGSDEPRDCN